MIAEGRPVEVSCHFCNEHYQVSVPELQKIRAQID